ncbi:MAG: (d)CMP kinase [Betaproteobacteria bacterium]|nr:(d)CMP kinase [Betaproteobacteria bacterium]
MNSIIRHPIPVIAIDGPSASGKGTVADLVAQRLGFHCLDSGALYRLTALAASMKGVALDDETGLARLALNLDVEFTAGCVSLMGQVVDEAIRSEVIGVGASRVAQYGEVRKALLARQRTFRQAPGLVADGRDMGSVVFPDACLKIYLTASVDVRAERRYKQLMEKGIHVILHNLLDELRERDLRDATRQLAPLIQQADAVLLDTSQMTIAEAVEFVLVHYEKVRVRE